MRNFYYFLFICLFSFTIQVKSQVYFSQNFENGPFLGWVYSDLDGDGYTFFVPNASSIVPNFGNGSLVSFSYYNNVAYSPNNLAVSPAIDLSGVTASSVSLVYSLWTSPSYPADYYSVYVSTSNQANTVIATTPIHTETPTGGEQQRVLDLTPYIGQTIYIGFRHYNCTDQLYLIFDNISVETLPTEDVQLTSVNMPRYELMNTNVNPVLEIKNNGSNTATSVKVTWTDSNGTNEEIIPVNISTAATEMVAMTSNISYSTIVEENITFNITQVNGQADADPTNNSQIKEFNTISVDSPKKVLIEEGTGTWCGYCPRGIVAMEDMYTNHSDKFVGIAVHNGDPMTVVEYDNGASFNAFPGMNVDRKYLGEGVSYTTMENSVLNLYQNKVPASVIATGSINGSVATIEASTTFHTQFANGDYRLAVVIVEDNVSGTASGYAQTNYFAGSNTPMGGYESLPNPVPASQMVYDHVGRALLGGYNGQTGSVPTNISDGTTASYTFNYNIPASSVLSNLKAAVLLINNANGEVENVEEFELSTLGSEDIQAPEFEMGIYPNPAVDELHVKLNKNGLHIVNIFDSSGKLVDSKTINFDGSEIILPVNHLVQGSYMINVATQGESFNAHFIKK